jgi:predicted DNA-binding transcriptional regulator YafY
MNDTLLRQWAMLRYIPRYPNTIDASRLKAMLENAGHEITLRSIQRDLNNLSSALPLLSNNAKPQGWSWSEDASRLELPLLEPQAALTFHLVERHLHTLLPQSTLDYLSPWFKTASAIIENNTAEVTRWPDKIRVLPRGFRLQAPSIDSEVHATIYKALLEERCATILYHARNAADPKEYIINPIGVVVRDSLVYLICTFSGYTDVRYLVLHRIKNASLLDAAATVPAGFSLDAYIAAGHLGFSNDGQSIQLVARFTVSAATHLLECPVSDDQKIVPDGEGFVQVTATTPDTKELHWWLLGFGDQVTVIEPPSLLEQMQTIATNMAAAYKPVTAS